MNTQQLNDRFGVADQLVFREDASGLVVAEINNAAAEAAVCLQGAHLMHWRPKSQVEPVVWLSRDAKLAQGKSIRGGAPVCWPWFGAHATESSFPGHGYARTVLWEMVDSGSEADGATRLVLRLVESEKTRAQWPHACSLDLVVRVGATLEMELVTVNTGAAPFVIGEALHTYFKISDIGGVSVTGLDGCAYWDKMGETALRTQSGAVAFSGETDRVYVGTADTCVIEDVALARRILIAKTGSRSTVVWTPWVDKANKMGDMGQPDGWREMVCVESANALDDVVTVAPGERHVLSVRYSAEGM